MKKDVIENCLILDVNRIRIGQILRKGLPWWGPIQWTNKNSLSARLSQCENDQTYRLDLSYQKKDEKVNYQIEIVTTRCNFGGRRFWFICPGVKDGKPCRKRVGRLYAPSYAKYFLCRHCYDLSYQSRQTWKSQTELGLCFQILEAGMEMEKAMTKGPEGKRPSKRFLKKLKYIEGLAKRRGW